MLAMATTATVAALLFGMLAARATPVRRARSIRTIAAVWTERSPIAPTW
jgi:hypothetical protein